MKKLLTVSIFIILGFLVISFAGFAKVTRPTKEFSDIKAEQYKFKKIEDITLTSKDGTKLSAWLIESPTKNKKAVIYLHGYPAEKSFMLPTAAFMYYDYSALLLDFRYFGKSGGKFSSLGIKEQDDLQAAINFLQSKGYEKIALVGVSFGGATAILTAAKDSRINAVVSYAAFADLPQLGENLYKPLGPLKKPFVGLMALWSKIFFGDSFRNVSPAKLAKNLKIPILIVHNKTDEQIPFSSAEQIKEALKNNSKAEFYFPEKGGHNDLPLNFEFKVKEFLRRNF